MQIGRPTDYDETKVLAARAYLQTCKDGYEQQLNEKDEPGERRYTVNLPSVVGLAIYLDVARSTVYKWAKEHEEFSDILELVLAEQEQRLVNNGLAGTYNSTITKVILTKHGYKEETDTTHRIENLTDLLKQKLDGSGETSQQNTK